MKIFHQSIRGFHDIFPENTYYLENIEYLIKNILNSYTYSEIRIPILEKTKLFENTIGSDSDILKKEMYSFEDKKKKKISLRPEGTVGCIRACIQKKIFQISKIKKLWYYGPMFRYERPQKGRFRQFYQLGVECFGISDPIIDLEIILLTIRIWKKLKILKYLKLEINSIGSILERKKYSKDLSKFFKKNIHKLDKNFQKLLNFNNPIKLLDHKNIKIQNFIKNGPKLLDYLDIKSRKRFKKLCFLLDQNQITYNINSNLVRGLDYYNDTVFEWKDYKLGAQNTICAGGRYDTLVERLGGLKNPAIGFAIGIDRLFLLKEKIDTALFKKNFIDIYIICCHSIFFLFAMYISEKLRFIWPKLKIYINFSKKKIKNQIKKSKNINIKYILLLDSRELSINKILIKNILKKEKKIYFFNRIFQKPCIFI